MGFIMTFSYMYFDHIQPIYSLVRLPTLSPNSPPSTFVSFKMDSAYERKHVIFVF
jgi:hypothetical protein